MKLRNLSVALLALSFAACTDGSSGDGAGPDLSEASGASQPAEVPHFAYITNGAVSFWTIAEAGAYAGGEEYGVRVSVLLPAGGMTDQKNVIEDMLTKGVDGMAVSIIDPKNQIDLINEACEETIVITHDSDAPATNRLGFIGVDNYVAGRMCGALAKEAIPEGGKFAIFVGRTEQNNARRRRQGVIDEIFGRSIDPERNDPSDAKISSEDGKYQLVGTYTDQFDRARGKANVEDALARHPDLACVVCLFAYNTPLALEALRSADKLNEVAVASFDEADETLQGIIDGTVAGTVVQNPFLYGKDSIRVLKGLYHGESLAELGFDEDGFLEIPARTIRSDNVDAFWAELKKNLGQE